MTLSTSETRQRSLRGFRARARQGPARASASEPGRPRPDAPTREASPFDTEECDDGSGTDLDLCTNACQVSDTPVEVQDPEYPWELRSRTLGEGRHPISASTHGFGVTYLEPDSDPPIVGLSVFNNAATPGERIVVSEDATPALFANPVVAALSDGTYAVAWTDLIADGDATGIAVRKVEPDATLSSLGTANAEPDFSQYDADIVATDEGIVVASTDDRDPETGPDLYYRVLSDELGGSDEDQVLSASPALEGQVALAELGDSWGAAWRASTDDGKETIEVQDMGADVRWSIGPIDAGSAQDHPALMAVSKSLRLVVLSGHDPTDTDFSEPTRLWFAVV